LIAVKYGAYGLGLVSKMPSGPGVIEDKLINEIVTIVPPPISTFLLTSETKVEAIITHYNRVNTLTIQIVDELVNRQYQLLREELLNVRLIQVIHFINYNSVTEAIEISAIVDAILLDSGNPSLSVKELGGTGRIRNWDLSKQISESTRIPLFLADGLNKNNAKQAIKYLQPFGLEMCSSVRTNGQFDGQKLEENF
jgi:phosphoribosylanthranilate isomerase